MLSVVSFSRNTIFLMPGNWMSTEKKWVFHLEREPVTLTYITLSTALRMRIVGVDDMSMSICIDKRT